MTGSLQIKNNIFYAVLNFKDKNGNRKQKWISTELEAKGNKRKAEQILNDLKTQYDESDYIEPSKMLLCDFIKEWISLNKSNVQITTYDGYVHMLNAHIYPYFKQRGILLAKVKPIDIQRYYSEKLEYGLSPNTVIKHHAIIRTALKYAVKNNLIRENIADLVDKPKRVRYESSFYVKEELLKLFEVSEDSSIQTPILFASYYGLRRSEILGLKWTAIDFNNRIISICNKVVRAYTEDGKLIMVSQNKLKSETSHRSLPICNAIYEHLLNLKDQIEKNKSLFGNEYNYEYEDFICVNPMGNLLQPDYVSETFRKLLIKNNLKRIRFHDLRHSCATLLLSLGYNMKDIQEWLGHSDFLITANTYTHVDYKNKIQMINSVDCLFNPVETEC